MKTVECIGCKGYGATDDLRMALKTMGFGYLSPTIERGCHHGTVWFFDANLQRFKAFVDEDNIVAIVTETRKFFMHLQENGLCEFSVQPRMGF